MNEERKAFLPRLDAGRNQAVRFRQDWKRNAEQQMAAQGFAGMAGALFKDPVDETLPGWFSLALLFDSAKMDSSYGVQAFQPFFARVSPASLHDVLVSHFWDLIQFDSYCAILFRSKTLSDLAHIAKQFGPDFNATGLLPHSTRFLRAGKADGHLIARTFSLPTFAQFRNGVVHPDAQAGAGWIMEEAIKDTGWRCQAD
jgi:hypothetical protein